MKLIHDAERGEKKKAGGPTGEGPLQATTGEIVQVYFGPPSLLLATDQAVVPVLQTAFAYSYDYVLRKYRWTTQRPLCEHKDRYIEKVRRLVREHGATFGVGLVFAGSPFAPKDAHRRGVWLGGCATEDLTEAAHAPGFPGGQPVLDVVAGLAATCDAWEMPPVKPWTAPEF